MARFALALIIVLAAQVGLAQAEMPAKIRKHIDKHYIGSWNFTLKSEDEAVKGSFTAKWVPGKHCVLVTQKTSTQDGTVYESGIVAWRPDTETMVHHGFTSKGDYFQITYNDCDGDVWSGKATGLLEGKSFEDLDASVVWKGNGFTYKDELITFEATRK